MVFQGYNVNDTLTVAADTGGISGTVLTVYISDNQDVTLTTPNVKKPIPRQQMFCGPMVLPLSYYDFDATGQPAVGDSRLSYQAGDIKKMQTSWEVQVGTGRFNLKQEPRLQMLKHVRDCDVDTTVTGSTYLGETVQTETYITGYSPNTESVPEYWTRFEGRVDFGSNFTIKEFPTDAIKADYRSS